MEPGVVLDECLLDSRLDLPVVGVVVEHVFTPTPSGDQLVIVIVKATRQIGGILFVSCQCLSVTNTEVPKDTQILELPETASRILQMTE
jgi:hypothetical protein